MLKRIFVCLSRTLAITGPLDILENEKIIRQQGESQSTYQINPADRCALETAMQLKRDCGIEVIALTFSLPEEIAALKMAYACGADRCVHLMHPVGALIDGWVAARMIATYLTGVLQTSDIILCGDSLADTSGAQVGPIIAELLGLPQITHVVNVTHQPGSNFIEAFRLLERGDRQRVSCTLPALAAVSQFGVPGRYTAMLRALQTPANKIETVDANPIAVGVQPLCQVKSISRPRPRTKKVAAPSAKLSAADRMKFLMSGGQAKQESSLFEGSPEEAADRIINYLQENNLIN
jgi:electron transfer flavoprotein beta subunit